MSSGESKATAVAPSAASAVEESKMTLPNNKPPLQLTDTDGNAFAVLGHARRTEATAGDYDHLLATCMNFFDVS